MRATFESKSNSYMYKFSSVENNTILENINLTDFISFLFLISINMPLSYWNKITNFTIINLSKGMIKLKVLLSNIYYFL